VQDTDAFPQSLAPTMTLQIRGREDPTDVPDGSIVKLSAPVLELLANFTAERFDRTSRLSTEGTGAIIEVEVDVSALLNRWGTSSQAALQRLLLHFNATADGGDGAEDEAGEHWAAGTSRPPTTNAHTMRLSPPGVVNLYAESREVSGIPSTAFCFCMAHGIFPADSQQRRWPATKVLEATGVSHDDAAAAFLITGGFIYFDAMGKIVATKVCHWLSVRR
jgi:hypothetical protein